MNLILKTKVNGNYKDIINKFDLDLFEALAPPGPKIEIVKFTGSKKGDRVHIRFLSPIKTEWISDITADEINESEAFFIDEGVKLPFPLKHWKHKHIVRKIDENNSEIIDDITYKGANGLLTLLMYPAMFIGFFPRKRIYQNIFGKPKMS